MQNNRIVGAKYEKLAGVFLEEKGYEILQYNYRCPLGEIDLVAKDKEELVFIEVKYRKNLKKGSPLEAVTLKKQMIIGKCAKHYLMSHYKYERDCRFDVIGIVGDQITHIEGGFFV